MINIIIIYINFKCQVIINDATILLIIWISK